MPDSLVPAVTRSTDNVSRTYIPIRPFSESTPEGFCSGTANTVSRLPGSWAITGINNHVTIYDCRTCTAHTAAIPANQSQALHLNSHPEVKSSFHLFPHISAHASVHRGAAPDGRIDTAVLGTHKNCTHSNSWLGAGSKRIREGKRPFQRQVRDFRKR